MCVCVNELKSLGVRCDTDLVSCPRHILSVGAHFGPVFGSEVGGIIRLHQGSCGPRTGSPSRGAAPRHTHLKSLSWNFVLSLPDPSLVPALALQSGVWWVLSWSSLQAQHQGALPWGSVVLPDKVGLAGAGGTDPLPACKWQAWFFGSGTRGCKRW